MADEETRRRQHAAYMRSWRIDHKQQAVVINRTYRERHTEQLSISKAVYRQTHKEEMKLYHRGWYLLHKDEITTRVRNWDAVHPDKKREYGRRNTRKRQQRLVGGRHDLTIAEWESIKERQGYKCFMCGQIKPLTQDHIIPLSHGGEYTADNIQGLCLSCNDKKGSRIDVQ